MIQHPSYTIEPWSLHENSLCLDILAQSESLFALSNGHIGIRGNFEEGEPHGMPGTYLCGYYETRPLPMAELQYGEPHASQSLINVTNGKLIRLLVDDEPFDVRYGTVKSHDRILDFRAGTLKRTVEWCSPAGCSVRVSSTRFVSFTHRSIVAISYEVELLDAGETSADFVVQSELVANEQLPSSGKDPRIAAALDSPLVAEEHESHESAALMIHRTRNTGLRIAAGMEHVFHGTDQLKTVTQASEHSARWVLSDVLKPGQKLRVTKYIAYGWSHERSRPAMRDQVAAALLAAKNAGWDTLLREQREYLDQFWDSADVQIEGDTELQQAVRFSLFQVLSSGARTEGRAIPAKGLTGTGYDGHAFWDTDLYINRMLSYIAPGAAEKFLEWRHSTLGIARKHAKELGLSGAAFPWRTIHGEECSGYWPAGIAAFHINAAVAVSVLSYVRATGDLDFERDYGVDLLVETARLWRSLGHFDLDGNFRIDGVTGPDEYSAVADNNVYTNLMAQRNLRGAAEVCQRYQEKAAALGVTADEMAGWRAAADKMSIPYDEKLKVHPQSEGFTQHEPWNFEKTRADQYPLLLHFPYFQLYRKQVVKQADLVLAIELCCDAFTPEQRARDFEYYERITVRDSSLSACTQAIAAADTGHLRLALDYAAESALMDLKDLEENARDGLHVASLAGTWLAFVAGFGGMRHNGQFLAFAPRLPEGLTGLKFSILYRKSCLRVAIKNDRVEYLLAHGAESVKIEHHGEVLLLNRGKSVLRPIPCTPEREAPSQPSGRAPRRRIGLRKEAA